MIPPPLRPLPLKNRMSYLFLEYGRLDVLDGAFVLVDENGVRVHIPVGSVTCLFLEPGTRVSHEAVKLAAKVGCLLLWVGEGGVRLYAAGQPGGARADRLLYQAALALDEKSRLNVVRKMFAVRFGIDPPANRSVDQLRGLEGARVRKLYQQLGTRYGVKWKKRDYDTENWDASNLVNMCLSVANSCLYGIVEAAILACGYAPAVGFVHTGKPLSFVYDIADLVKFDTVVPLAFQIAGESPDNPERAVRKACRDKFKATKILGRLIPLIDEVLAAGGLPVPKAMGVVGPAFEEERGFGDDGHRG